MNIKIINPIDVPDWNDQISKFPDATIFHTSNWAWVLSESYGYKPLYFCTYESNSLTGFIPLMEINSYITGKRGVSLPFSDQVDSLVRDKNHFEAIFNKVVLYAKSRNWKTFSFFDNNSFLNSSQPSEIYVSSHLNLEKDPDQLLKNFKSSTLRNIKKASKSGITTRIDNSIQSLTQFYHLNCITRKGHGIPPQPFLFFKNLHKEIFQKKLGFICLGYFGKKPVSGAVFFTFNQKAVYKYGASKKKFLPFRPNNIVIWEALKYCSSIGLKCVNFGRSELHHSGLLQFKRSWGCSESPINFFKFKPSTETFLNSHSGIKSSYKLFQNLPIPVLKFLGYFLYKHVG